MEIQAYGQPARKASEALSDKDPGEGPYGGRRGAARGPGDSVRTKGRGRRRSLSGTLKPLSFYNRLKS